MVCVVTSSVRTAQKRKKKEKEKEKKKKVYVNMLKRATLTSSALSIQHHVIRTFIGDGTSAPLPGSELDIIYKNDYLDSADNHADNSPSFFLFFLFLVSLSWFCFCVSCY